MVIIYVENYIVNSQTCAIVRRVHFVEYISQMTDPTSKTPNNQKTLRVIRVLRVKPKVQLRVDDHKYYT